MWLYRMKNSNNDNTITTTTRHHQKCLEEKIERSQTPSVCKSHMRLENYTICIRGDILDVGCWCCMCAKYLSDRQGFMSNWDELFSFIISWKEKVEKRERTIALKKIKKNMYNKKKEVFIAFVSLSPFFFLFSNEKWKNSGTKDWMRTFVRSIDRNGKKNEEISCCNH